MTHRLLTSPLPDFLKTLVIILLVAAGLCSCHEKKEDVHITIESFAELRQPVYEISSEQLGEDIRRIAMADKDRETPDIHLRRHYLGGGALVWVTRQGVSAKADSVLRYIHDTDSFGFSREKFSYSIIERDLRTARSLAFTEGADSRDNINKVYARLEYHLSKAFLRYAEGQRFGYMNPYDAFNRIDVRDSDSVSVSYRSLYDVPTKRADKDFVARAFVVMSGDAAGVASFLRESKPENPLYEVLRQRLGQVHGAAERRLVLCNMERARWRHGDYPQSHRKYVVVNVPSLHLIAADGDERITMRVGLGSLDTKTPLLTSRVKRMDFNPQWIIPKSIIKTSVRHHAGNRAYFDSRDYFIRNRGTGKEVDPATVTGDMLMSKDYLVIQRGGVGNALGRVIFRFDNNFSIFMHDTSNPGVFSRSDRSVSHGCIRVERPYDLAVFMLKDKDEALMEKMKYSMTVNYGRTRTADDEANEPIDKSKMLGSLKVEPQVPVFITYYTLYPDAGGALVPYSDIYGFDSVIYRHIQKYF